MDKYKRNASNKFILLGIIVGCFLIVFIGFHFGTKGGEKKAVHKNASKVTLTSIHKATEAKFQSVNLDNIDLSNVKEISSIDSLYKGIFYLPDTSSTVKKKAVSYFKKQSEEMKRKYNKKYLIPYNKKYLLPYNKEYVPLGRDYRIDEQNEMTYSTTGFFTSFENFDSANLNLSYTKEEDLVKNDILLRDRVLKKRIAEVHKLIRNTGCTFDVQLSPHVLRTSTNEQGEKIKDLSFQISYKGVPFSDISPDINKYVSWSGCETKWVDGKEDSKCIILSKMALMPKKLQKVKRIISAKKAIDYLSKKLSEYHKYTVSSIQMEYVSTLTEKEIREGKQDLYLNPLVEGGEYVVKPYWVIYFNGSKDNSVVGYVNAETGEVLFFNGQL
jgi:hypothetical protein